eukprot:GEMP01090050.1.p1 GENE.GEMP01090050.1~~GEMP01090050.1.p1  ORF type:complete len:150 (+),score=40.92 GEMP01090050.1:241-690(+)
MGSPLSIIIPTSDGENLGDVKVPSPLVSALSRQIRIRQEEKQRTRRQDAEEDAGLEDEAKQRMLANGVPLWLCFNRLTEDWGPKVRNELLTSMLEGSVHPDRTQQVGNIMSAYGSFLSFDEFTEVMDTLRLQRNEWKVLVRVVRLTSAQ